MVSFLPNHSPHHRLYLIPTMTRQLRFGIYLSDVVITPLDVSDIIC